MSEYTGSKRHGWTFAATASTDGSRAVAICGACGVTRDVATGGRLSLGGRCDGEWHEPTVRPGAKNTGAP
ncbi:MAG: hypothetical protein ABWZ82_03865 [Candidatus Limnocylindrales bacterium]